jgi:hypothetical protein
LSERRKKQIEKYESYLNSVESCPNGHPYIDGSFKITEDNRGRIYRTCLECLDANAKRKNHPMNRAAIALANIRGISKEEALEFLQTSPKKKEDKEGETIQ